MAKASSRVETKDLFLDAAERLLVQVGYAGIMTRAVAEEAGANHGLVHILLRVDGRALRPGARALHPASHRALALDVLRGHPFHREWRAAMSYLEKDLVSGYEKVWLELQALAWNKPDLRDRVTLVNAEWRSVVTDAISQAAK